MMIAMILQCSGGHHDPSLCRDASLGAVAVMTAYVYAITVDGVIRYIGKGSGIPMKRAQEHIRTAKRLIKRRKAGEVLWASNLYNRLAKAVDAGCDVRAICLVSNLTDEQAFQEERLQIDNAIGLWNLDSGGLGGKRISEAHRAKLSEASKRRVARPGEIDRLRALGTQPENIARLQSYNRIPKRPETLAKYRELAIKRWANPIKAARMKVGLKARWREPKWENQLEFLWEPLVIMKT